MFGKERPAAAFEGKIENVFGPTATFQGQVKAEGNVRVDGNFDGTIETAGNVIIGEKARVTADIDAGNVQVWGALKGNVTASGRLEILPTGRVWGDIRVNSLLIDDGGIFRGSSVLIGSQDETFPAEEAGEDEPVEDAPPD